VGVVEDGAVRPAPVLFALLALICFGVALLFPGWGTFMLGVLGVVVFIVLAIYAWMIL
jgi:hypothetical protein